MSQTERILSACSCGCGLREAIAGLSCEDRRCLIVGPRDGRYVASVGQYTMVLYGASAIVAFCRALGLEPVWLLDEPVIDLDHPSGICGG